MIYITQEELDALYETKKEGKAIVNIEGESAFNIKNERGIVKWVDGRTEFIKNQYEYIKGHYIFHPNNKVKYGRNVFVVNENEIQWLK